MAIKTKQWYEAYDKYSDEKPWHNYFFELGNTVKYISVEPDFRDASYIEESMEDFEINILDNYEFGETEIYGDLFYEVVKSLKKESKDNKREIIKGFLS